MSGQRAHSREVNLPSRMLSNPQTPSAVEDNGDTRPIVRANIPANISRISTEYFRRMPTLALGTFTRPVIFRKPPAWCNVRRKFDDIQVATGSPIAAEAIQPVGALYGIDREIRGKPIKLRHEICKMRDRPLVEKLHPWMNKTLAKISRKSDTARAHSIRAIALAGAYALSQ